jgi:glycerol transport system permease protein
MSRFATVLAADVPLLAAAGVLGLVPGIILIFFMKKHLARGFSMGRVI